MEIKGIREPVITAEIGKLDGIIISCIRGGLAIIVALIMDAIYIGFYYSDLGPYEPLKYLAIVILLATICHFWFRCLSQYCET